MAYERQTWECGDTITAEKLNHIENGIEEASSGGDAGYECTSASVSETVTTTATPYNYARGTLNYDGEISGDTLRVILNGTEYVLPRASTNEYGERVNYNPSFDNYPLMITRNSQKQWGLYVKDAGTYTIELPDVYTTTIESITPCFKKVVEQVAEPLIPEPFEPFNVSFGADWSNVSFEELQSAYYGEKYIIGSLVTAAGGYTTRTSLVFATYDIVQTFYFIFIEFVDGKLKSVIKKYSPSGIETIEKTITTA